MTGPPQALDSLSTSDSMAGDGAATAAPMPQIAANDTASLGNSGRCEHLASSD